eukprot:CFRG4491T1
MNSFVLTFTAFMAIFAQMVAASAVSSNYVSWCVYASSSCHPDAEIECSLVPMDGVCNTQHFDTHSFILRYTNTSDVLVDFFGTDDCSGDNYEIMTAIDSCGSYFDHSGTNYLFLSLVNEAVAEGIVQSEDASSTADTALNVGIAALVLALLFGVGSFCGLVWIVRSGRRTWVPSSSIHSPSDSKMMT